MSHYDIISIIAGCFLIIISFGILASVLASRSWSQADQMAHEVFDETPIQWDATALMKNCPECQDEQRQVL